MTVTTPSWADSSVPLTLGVIAAGDTPNIQVLDLKAAFGAWLWIQGVRRNNTAVDVPIKYVVNRLSGTLGHPNSPFARVGNETTAADTTVDGDSAAGQEVLQVTDTAGFSAGEFIGIQATAGAGAEYEVARISKITSPGAGGNLVLDRGLEFTHESADSDVVTNQADLFQMWLPGGSDYELGADFGEASSAGDVTVRMLAQVWNNLGTV